MKTQIHHSALNVKDFNWYVSFFEDVFEMSIRQTRGAVPNRKLWFHQGIQLNECPNNTTAGTLYDHIGISTDNPEEVLSRALKKGCVQIPDKPRWFRLPDGIVIELM